MTSSSAERGLNAIARKLDPKLPGFHESFIELEAANLPRFQSGFPPQRLTMTLLGEFWVGRSEPIPSAALVQLLRAFNITESAARAALSRLAARGALILERRGRTTWYRQSPNLLMLLPQGRAMTLNFGPSRTGWDGSWSIVSWNLINPTPALTHRIRISLRELGYAPLAPGVWVSPGQAPDRLVDMLPHPDDMTFSVFTAQELPVEGAASAVSAFDLSEMELAYEEFLATFSPLLTASRASGFPPAEALVARTRAVFRWFVIATLDPDLPAELLPPKWSRTEAHRLFVALVDGVTPMAESYVRSVIAQFDADTAELVTAPAPYAIRRESFYNS